MTNFAWKRLILGGLWMVCWHMAACGPIEEAPVANQEGSIQTHERMINGQQVPAGSQYDDTMLLTKADNYTWNCGATLLTNNWVLTAQHCQSLPGQGPDVVYYNHACSKDADCSARGAKCITAIGYCGSIVQSIVNNPNSGSGNQVQLWKLTTPILSTIQPGRYSIAQQVWNGTKNGLNGKTITILGGSNSNGTMGPMKQGSFKINKVSSTWSYVVSDTGGQTLIDGDSGGPGYLPSYGLNYLTGVTVTPDPNGSQHDLPEVYGWLDDTLFNAPSLMQSNVQGFAMALTPNGAVQTFLRNNVYYFSQCSTEPCDSRGSWSTPGWFISGYTSPPAIAYDIISGYDGAQVFVATPSGVTASALAQGYGYAGTVNLGGGCGPVAADSRPRYLGNSPTLDVTCRGTDGNLWINQRVSGSFGGWYSLGSPAGGILSGIAPAIVSNDWNTTRIAVVGADGNVYVEAGAGGSGWLGWVSRGKAPNNVNFKSVAIASYAPERVDLIAIDANGVMWHQIGTGNTVVPNWSQSWTQITRGGWGTSLPPFAASYGWKYGLLNVGAVDPWGNAQLQRYSDW